MRCYGVLYLCEHVVASRNLVVRSDCGTKNRFKNHGSRYGIDPKAVSSVVLLVVGLDHVVGLLAVPVVQTSCLHQSSVAYSVGLQLPSGERARDYNRSVLLPQSLGEACEKNNKQRWVFHSAGKLSLSGTLPLHPSFKTSGPLALRNTSKLLLQLAICTIKYPRNCWELTSSGLVNSVCHR